MWKETRLVRRHPACGARRGRYTAAVIRTTRFSFQRRGPKRVALRFSVNPLAGEWDAVEVRVDAVVIGTATREMCWQGVEYALFDGSVLRMWLESPPGGHPFLNVTRNGHPLPGSEGDPLHQVRAMVVMLWVLAAIEILVEMIVVMSIHRRNDPDQLLTDYWITGVAAIVMLLGILAWRRSVPALVFACTLFAGQLFLYFALHPSWSLLWTGLFPMIGLVWLIQRAIRGAVDLEAMRLPIRRPLPGS
jgi:hypothetical protein